MDNDFFTLKNMLACVATPLTVLIGWCYKNVDNKIDRVDDESKKISVVVGKHSIRLDYLDECVSKLDDRMDTFLDNVDKKIDTIINKLDKVK